MPTPIASRMVNVEIQNGFQRPWFEDFEALTDRLGSSAASTVWDTVASRGCINFGGVVYLRGRILAD